MSRRVNLLKETLDMMKKHDLTESDIVYINVPRESYNEERKRYETENHFITFDLFKRIANCEYDSGYGIAEVNTGLNILFTKGVMYREEYDGCEYWKYIEFHKDVKFDENDYDVELWI